MKRFRNILVLYDDAPGGDDALAQASVLARENGARLTLATVVRENRLTAAVREETAKRLERIVCGLRQDGIADADAIVLAGAPAYQLTRQVVRGEHDLVILSTEGGNALRERLFGSTAVRLMRQCPCPVWAVRPGGTVPCRRIVAALDPHPDPEGDALGERILQVAASLATYYGATLHLVHAWDVDGKDHDTVRSEIDETQRTEIIARHRRRHHAALDDLISRNSIATVDHRLHLPRGNPEAAIRKLADEQEADLVIMGTHARSSLSRLIVGTPFETVLGSSGRSLLTVKPDGFRPPVSMTGGPAVAERRVA